MRAFGNLLLALGALVGAGVGVGILFHAQGALPFFIAVGIAKLMIVASFGLMAAGAVLHRVARRDEERRRRSERGISL